MNIDISHHAIRIVRVLLKWRFSLETNLEMIRAKGHMAI